MVSKSKFNIGDVICDGEMTGTYVGHGDIKELIVIDGPEGWSAFSSAEEKAARAAGIDPSGKTGWYVALGLCSLVRPVVKEPTAPMTLAVLNLLRKKETLTSLEAQGVLRCRQLPARILELKRLGHKIVTEIKLDPTGQKYARYHLQPTG